MKGTGGSITFSYYETFGIKPTFFIKKCARTRLQLCKEFHEFSGDTDFRLKGKGDGNEVGVLGGERKEGRGLRARRRGEKGSVKRERRGVGLPKFIGR